MIRIILAGATGWVGRALVPAIAKAADLELVAAISRNHAGTDLGVALEGKPSGVPVFARIEEALATPADVLIDYTKPNVVKAHALAALKGGLHVVIGTSGLGAADYAELDTEATARGRGLLAAGNFSVTATLLKRFTLEAAKYVADVELIDYASAAKPDAPSGTGRELAEALAGVRQGATSRPVSEVDHSPRRRLLGRALCRRHAAGDAQGQRLDRGAARTGHAAGLNAGRSGFSPCRPRPPGRGSGWRSAAHW
jgi:4-hydroxy-tetrahydrodipicolinate reductase